MEIEVTLKLLDPKETSPTLCRQTLHPAKDSRALICRVYGPKAYTHIVSLLEDPEDQVGVSQEGFLEEE